MLGHLAKHLSQIVSNPYYNKSVKKYYIYHFLCEEIEAQITKVQFSSHVSQVQKPGLKYRSVLLLSLFYSTTLQSHVTLD